MNSKTKKLGVNFINFYIDIESIILLFLFIFFCMQFALNGHTIFAHSAYVLFVGTISLVLLLKKRFKLYYCEYFNCYIIFMFYNLLLVVFGVATYSDKSISSLIYMSVNLIFYIALYNYIVDNDNKETLLKITVWAAVVSLAFIMINVEDIWTGRLGHTMTSDKPSFYVYGIPLYLSSNSISTFADIGALFSLYFLGVNKKKIYLFTYLFLAFGVLLSGSRKGLLLLVLFTMYSIFVFFKGTNYGKVVKIIIASCILYYLVMKVPVFYNLIGKRTLKLISAIFGNEVSEASLNSRMRLAALARGYIYEKPFWGWGLSNFALLANSQYSVDNNYLDVLVSGGIFGFLIYYYYVIVAVKEYFSLHHSNRTLLTKTMFFVLLCFLILDTGSVVYNIRNSLTWIVVFFAFVALDNKNRIQTEEISL